MNTDIINRMFIKESMKINIKHGQITLTIIKIVVISNYLKNKKHQFP